MKNFLFLLLVVFLCACNNDKNQLVEEFKAINQLIEDQEYETLYNKVDFQSKEYISFLVDSLNQDFNKAHAFGVSKNLKYITIDLMNTVGNLKAYDDPNFLFTVFVFSGIPLFGPFQTTELREEQTVTGAENYVVLAKKVAENTYITSKVYLSKDPADGEYKLNILSLLKTNNKILGQQYNNYLKIKRADASFPNSKEALQQFYEEKANTDEYDLKELKYKRNVK